MNVLDFNGVCQIEGDEELLDRLRTVRRGTNGAFILDHGGDVSLWIHLNENEAYLWYCPDRGGKHAGFEPDGMWAGEKREVRFLQVNGCEADSITVFSRQLIPIDIAYRAAIEFLHSSALPPSVTWFEL